MHPLVELLICDIKYTLKPSGGRENREYKWKQMTFPTLVLSNGVIFGTANLQSCHSAFIFPRDFVPGGGQNSSQSEVYRARI